MSEVLALRIALGSSSEVLLDDDWLTFHTWLARRVNAMSNGDTLVGRSIPIRNQEVFETPAIVYQLVHQAVTGQAVRTLLIDCSGPFTGQLRGALQFHLAAAVRALTDLDRDMPRHIILTMGQLPVVSDIIHDLLLKPIRERRRLLLIDNDGATLGESWHLTDDFKGDYAWKRRVLGGDPGDLLAMKLIQRRGHFARPNTNRHHQFFYDASKCEDEIVSLLTPRLPASDKAMIVYDAPLSPWLEFCAITLATSAGLECQKYRKGLPVATIEGRNVLFLTDFVHTGETFRTVYSHLSTVAGTITPVTVLTTLPIHDGQVTVPIRDEAVRIQALLAVPQLEMLKTECRLCQVGMPLTDVTTEAYAMLTAYDMWTMHDKDSDKTETEPPPYRNALPRVPNTPAMVERYAPYIAFKLECLLTILALPVSDLVFVCVDEPGTSILTRYLKLLLGATVIRIPREALTAQFHQLQMERPEWFVELDSLRAIDVVTIDEMKVSGGTFRALRALIGHFGRNVVCEIPLIDYTADDQAAPRSASLYRIPYAQ